MEKKLDLRLAKQFWDDVLFEELGMKVIITNLPERKKHLYPNHMRCHEAHMNENPLATQLHLLEVMSVCVSTVDPINCVEFIDGTNVVSANDGYFYAFRISYWFRGFHANDGLRHPNNPEATNQEHVYDEIMKQRRILDLLDEARLWIKGKNIQFKTTMGLS